MRLFLHLVFKPATHYPWLDENNIQYASSGRIIINDDPLLPLQNDQS